ncbi:Diacylglycerol O-acyltransferase 2 [Podochytrium sp. JEL0797]|nr:Diacylglycerol O-acyltransferase 2 [Podochytrium sp. JEL0797]
MTKVAGMEFAPLHVPLERRLQTTAVALWISMVPICVCLFLALLWFSNVTRAIALVYIVFMLRCDAHEKGAKKSTWFRSLPFWTWFRDFFPISIRKEVELDAKKRYIFGYHPHGVLSLGAVSCFGSEACDITNVFPGLNISLLTLECHYKTPFFRDLILAMGVSSSSKKSINYILSQPAGSSLAIVIGGATEALDAFPGTNNLFLQSRLGFIKLGLQNGASLVPTFAFGENDVWDQVPNPEGSWLRAFQKVVKRISTISPVLFHGRGIFTYDYGVLPYRKPIVVVTGKPIDLPVITEPTEVELKKYQKLYIDELKRVYDAYKDELLPDRKTDLVIS